MSDQEFFDRSASEEESLFARDLNGQLVRVDPVTEASLKKEITLKIDGMDVTVFEAVPLTDAQGNILHDEKGNVIPRPTTVYDAAAKAYAERGLPNPIPILCHQDHLNPVAVCRVCSVGLSQMARGKRRTERKLFPACQLRVDDKGMEVHTVKSPDPEMSKQVCTAVGTLTQLLVGDHLLSTPAAAELDNPQALQGNELAALARRFEITSSPFPQRTLQRGRDESSPLVVVDHEACILCDRCVRACDEVKQNHIIGRTKKGYATHIGFDLNDRMGESNCVACGECMINCPTGAMTLQPEVLKKARSRDENQGEGVDVLSAEEVKAYPLFASMSYKFLEWNTGAVRRRTVKTGEVLCRQGDPGRTAFILIRGNFAIRVRPKKTAEKKSANGWQSFFERWLGGGKSEPEGAEITVAHVTPADIVVGEMTCMSHYPRAATIQAEEPGEVLEINRNILYYLLRDRRARSMLVEAYRQRALADHLRRVPFLAAATTGDDGELEQLQRDCAEFLAKRVDLIHVDPGEVIFRQGDAADHYYQVRLGFVKFSQQQNGQERILNYFGPGKSFGEIGLLSAMQAIGRDGMTAGDRTATCTALDDVELVRISGEHFRELVERFPAARKLLIDYAEQLLAKSQAEQPKLAAPLDDFLTQGLYNAQRLLVLDLESCTRCDECTRACSDTHSGIIRLIRDGRRFDKYLVAGSCRSCLDPYCLVGCPVDAIHRKPRDNPDLALEIVIEKDCIGCGLCSRNCPYGNINMHPLPDDPTGQRWQAATCDLCREVVSADAETSCVYACPHEAAQRMSGADLWKKVNSGSASAV